MNKIDFAKINKKEDMIMVFNQLKDDYSIAFQQIQELTNNWNELEEWLKEQYEFIDTISEFPTIKEIQQEHLIMLNDYENVLDKMKEIKEGNNG